MGWIILICLVIGDLWLYRKGGRPEKSVWRDDAFRWM